MSGVRGFVGVTDNSWYRLLADRPDLLGEVNFWRPGGGGFQALRPGEPFFFKTHAPHNRVVGGGFFGGAARLPASEAWDLLGPANGAISQEQMLDRIAHYRRGPRAPGEDPVIGCIFIRDVTFFPDDLTFDPPPDFSSNIVQGKTYDLGDERYSRYFHDALGPDVLPFLPQWHYLHIHNEVLPYAREHGVTETQIAIMLTANPRRLFEKTGGSPEALTGI